MYQILASFPFLHFLSNQTSYKTDMKLDNFLFFKINYIRSVPLAQKIESRESWGRLRSFTYWKKKIYRNKRLRWNRNRKRERERENRVRNLQEAFVLELSVEATEAFLFDRLQHVLRHRRCHLSLSLLPRSLYLSLYLME